jgi:hypothetical protein
VRPGSDVGGPEAGRSGIAAVHSGTDVESQLTDASAAIVMVLFTTRPIPDICAMGSISLEDFSQSVASDLEARLMVAG